MPPPPQKKKTYEIANAARAPSLWAGAWEQPSPDTGMKMMNLVALGGSKMPLGAAEELGDKFRPLPHVSSGA